VFFPRKLTLWFLTGVLLLSGRSAHAEEAEPTRPFHLVAAAGYYAALGSPAGWGPTLSVDMLPGSFADRYGLRAEWRGYRKLSEGSALVSLLFEAGASRPQLALKLLAEAGLTFDGNPILGGGVEWSFWVFGPVGVSLLTDLQVIVDGVDTRPALSISFGVHIGG